ncbi:MAG: succinate--CoA ligase subunit alpha [Hyphomicrobiaceae bacterium]
MTILLDRDTRIVVHGAESRSGRFQLGEMTRYGRQLAGAVPSRPGAIEPPLPVPVPVYESVAEAVKQTGADLLLVFTPQLQVKAVVIEAIYAGVSTVVCLTDDVPLHDAVELRQRAERAKVILLGPNSTGLLSPGTGKAGYYSEDVCMPGRVGVISKSGSLAYAVMSEMMSFGIGVSTISGIGGDAVRGASFAELLPLYEDDPETDAIVMLGEIGGDDEERAARIIPGRMSKPVVAFISGRSVPLGQSMGHAGAIAEAGRGDYETKTKALRDAGVHVAATIGDVVGILRTLRKA